MRSISPKLQNVRESILDKAKKPIACITLGLGTVGFLGGTQQGRDVCGQASNAVGNLLAAPEDKGQEFRPIHETEKLDEQVAKDEATLLEQSSLTDYDLLLEDKEFPNWLKERGLTYVIPSISEFIQEQKDKLSTDLPANVINKISNRTPYYLLQQLQMVEGNFLEAEIANEPKLHTEFLKFLKDHSSEYPKISTRNLDYSKPLFKQVYDQFTEKEKQMPDKDKLMIYEGIRADLTKAINDFSEYRYHQQTLADIANFEKK